MALVLVEALDRCPSCGGSLNQHAYSLIASQIISKATESRLETFLALIRCHRWQEIREFSEWRGNEVNAEFFGIKCPTSPISAVVLWSPASLDEPYQVIYQEVLPSEASEELDHLINNWTIFSDV
jgi:hypothetical protein